MSYWQNLLVGLGAFVVVTAAAADVTKLTLSVEGMTQTGCSSPRAIERTATKFPGVRDADVIERGQITLEYEADHVELEGLLATVEKMCQVKITRPPAR